jgi:hypothetical protein
MTFTWNEDIAYIGVLRSKEIDPETLKDDYSNVQIINMTVVFFEREISCPIRVDDYKALIMSEAILKSTIFKL